MLRRHPLILLAGLTLLASPLIAQPEKPAPALKVEPAAKPAALPEPVITLLDPGAEAGRRELRFKLTEGATDTMVMSMKMGMEMTMNEQAMPKTELPTMTFTVTMKVEKIDESGDATCVLEFTDAAIADEEGVIPAVRDGMQDAAAKVKGMGAEVVISDRGITRSSKTRGDAKDPQVAQLMESMNQSMQQMSCPFPKEAVGVGAKWQVVTTPNLGGFTQTLTATYTLTSLTEDGAKFDAVMEQSAKEQDVNNPALPEGASARIKSLTGSGKGSTEFKFSRTTPVASTASSKATIDMTIKFGGEDSTMKQVVTTDVKIQKAADVKK